MRTWQELLQLFKNNLNKFLLIVTLNYYRTIEKQSNQLVTNKANVHLLYELYGLDFYCKK